jgi:Cft2 family RNA processing exonuclease
MSRGLRADPAQTTRRRSHRDAALRRNIGEVRLSLHPAGHVIGSAQVRIEHRGEVWVASGDYKLEADGVSAPLSCPCDVLSPNDSSVC